MIEYIAIFVASLVATAISMPYFIKKFKEIDLVSKDLNKPNKPTIPEMGGIGILFGVIVGILVIIAFSSQNLTQLLAVLSVVLIAGVLGLLDGILGYFKNSKSESTTRLSPWNRGISQLQHALLPLIAALPLIAIKVGDYSMVIPFIGEVNFGLIYPIIIVPVIITIYYNSFNMLAGLNGLEGGSGLVLSVGLLITGILTNNPLLISICLALIGPLIVFLLYNFYPAKIFPGDITPFILGAVLGSAVIIGNIERVGVIIIGLYYIEFLLKLRSKFKAQSFGIPNSDGSLKMPYNKIYSLTHFVMKLGKEKFKEWQIVLIILALHLIPVILAISLIGL